MTTIIDVKQAVDSATAYFSKLMPVEDVRLEEVEISDDERFWYVTLSALVRPPNATQPGPSEASTSHLAGLFKGDRERVYKVFTVDSVTGAVRSMKIREHQ